MKSHEFHNFNVFFRDNPLYEVVAFTAGQIPGIAGRIYPPSLAGPNYPNGIPIYEETELEKIVKEKKVDLVVFSYSDLTHEEVMHKASLALSLGADFMFLGTRSTMVESTKKVVAVTALRTGAGKSTVSRLVVKILRNMGFKPVVVRHPMPYGVLEKQVVQRIERVEDLDRYGCTVEEREEFEPHILSGTLVFAGVDYEKVVREAEKEADVIVWDGGNNDFPFIKPSLHIVVVDASKPSLEADTYPGEVNLLMADMIVLSKVDKAPTDKVKQFSEALRKINPRASIAKTASKPDLTKLGHLRGVRVCVVEDGPSVTHGGMSVGTAYEAALAVGAKIVDPKPYSVGVIRQVYNQFPHIGPVLPAIGYTSQQLSDLEKTIASVDCEAILSSSPADLSRLIKVDKPIYRVVLEAEEVEGEELTRALMKLFS